MDYATRNEQGWRIEGPRPPGFRMVRAHEIRRGNIQVVVLLAAIGGWGRFGTEIEYRMLWQRGIRGLGLRRESGRWVDCLRSHGMVRRDQVQGAQPTHLLCPTLGPSERSALTLIVAARKLLARQVTGISGDPTPPSPIELSSLCAYLTVW